MMSADKFGRHKTGEVVEERVEKRERLALGNRV